MKRAAFLTVVSIVALTSARAFPTATSAQTNQTTHQPLGGAVVSPAVVIRGFAPSLPVGLSSDITGARHWSANVRGVPKTLDFGATMIIRGGTPTGALKTLASMVIKERRLAPTGAPNEPERFALTFTPKVQSPTYRLEIWNGPAMVFEVNGLRAGGTVLAGNDAICDAIGKARSVALGICYFTIGSCSSIDDDGRFHWTIFRSSPVPWVIPAVSQAAVVGDQLRIIEETPSNSAKVVFKSASVTGTNLSEMVLMDELATAAAPEGHRPGQ